MSKSGAFHSLRQFTVNLKLVAQFCGKNLLFALSQPVLAIQNYSHLIEEINRSLTLFLSQPDRFSRAPFGYSEKRLLALKNQTQNLHDTFERSQKARVSFSILVPVYKPPMPFFEKMVHSLLEQTSNRYEILIGFDGLDQLLWKERVMAISGQHPNGSRVRIYEFERNPNLCGISATTNRLAEHAQNDFLVLMDHDDWIRPDLLFHYETTLAQLEHHKETVLFCEELKIKENDLVIRNSETNKSNLSPFPFLFANEICHCLALSRTMWTKVGGLKSEFDGAQDFDLILRLDLLGASFTRVPECLYAWRSHGASTAGGANNKSYAAEAGKRALEQYHKAKGLNCSVADGIRPTWYKVYPAQDLHAVTHVFLSLDGFDLTASEAQKVLSLANPRRKITLIQNSTSKVDPLLSQNEHLELLVFPATLNWSYIQNLAVGKSKWQNCTTLYFSTLENCASASTIDFMSAWVSQPRIGAVAPLYDTLNPSGTVKVVRQCNGLVISKSVFQSVKGYDEIGSPIYGIEKLAEQVQAQKYFILGLTDVTRLFTSNGSDKNIAN